MVPIRSKFSSYGPEGSATVQAESELPATIYVCRGKHHVLWAGRPLEPACFGPREVPQSDALFHTSCAMQILLESTWSSSRRDRLRSSSCVCALLWRLAFAGYGDLQTMPPGCTVAMSMEDTTPQTRAAAMTCTPFTCFPC